MNRGIGIRIIRSNHKFHFQVFAGTIFRGGGIFFGNLYVDLKEFAGLLVATLSEPLLVIR